MTPPASEGSRRERLFVAVGQALRTLPRSNAVTGLVSTVLGSASTPPNIPNAVAAHFSERDYRRALAAGHIVSDDLEVAVDVAVRDKRLSPTWRDAALAAVLNGLPDHDAARVRWELSEHRALCETSDRASLWSICLSLVSQYPATPRRPATPPTALEALRRLSHEDPRELVDTALMRVCTAWLDHAARWSMPRDPGGLYTSWRALVRAGPEPLGWRRGLKAMLIASPTAESMALCSLDDLGIPEVNWSEFVTESLCEHPTWATFLYQPDSATVSPPVEAIDYLAVRLCLTRLALSHIARRFIHYTGPLSGLAHLSTNSTNTPTTTSPPTADQQLCRAWKLFHLALALNLDSTKLSSLRPRAQRDLTSASDGLDTSLRRELLRDAYEIHHRDQVLTTVLSSRARSLTVLSPDGPPRLPTLQVITCSSVHEEPLRRRLETHPSVDTLASLSFSTFLPPASLLNRRDRERLSFSSRFTFFSTLLTRRRASTPDPDGSLSTPTAPQTFSLDDKARQLANLLSPIGLATHFAPVVVVVGHHVCRPADSPRPTHSHCSVCLGQASEANAQLLVSFANDREVRARLITFGINIPDTTVFITAHHNFDTHHIEVIVPSTITNVCLASLSLFNNLLSHPSSDRHPGPAHSSLSLSLDTHFKPRSHRNPGPRPAPEIYIPDHHNLLLSPLAVCVIGRRHLTQFIPIEFAPTWVSFDPSNDPDGQHLTRSIASVVTVFTGIDLSQHPLHVRPRSSDEPPRPVLIVEATPEHLNRVFARLPSLRALFDSGLMRLALIDPSLGIVKIYTLSAFVPWSFLSSQPPQHNPDLSRSAVGTDHSPRSGHAHS